MDLTAIYRRNIRRTSFFFERKHFLTDLETKYNVPKIICTIYVFDDGINSIGMKIQICQKQRITLFYAESENVK
jgi:hypothetical protein